MRTIPMQSVYVLLVKVLLLKSSSIQFFSVVWRFKMETRKNAVVEYLQREMEICKQQKSYMEICKQQSEGNGDMQGAKREKWRYASSKARSKCATYRR